MDTTDPVRVGVVGCGFQGLMMAAAVMRSDFSIENFVIGWNDGSWPTIVMSVPCSVVITFTSAPVSRSISRAIHALVACGIA